MTQTHPLIIHRIIIITLAQHPLQYPHSNTLSNPLHPPLPQALYGNSWSVFVIYIPSCNTPSWTITESTLQPSPSTFLNYLMIHPPTHFILGCCMAIREVYSWAIVRGRALAHSLGESILEYSAARDVRAATWATTDTMAQWHKGSYHKDKG